MGNLLVAKSNANHYLIRSRQEENKFDEFYFHNAIKFSQHDRGYNQLKLFFGFDPENPATSFYPDSLIVDYSDYVRDMYKMKLNDMTMTK